ncbi:MAG: hypothetical protein GEU73_11425 [Chloroflexi bacterium]|nr:hypothetical protein [Chloroflexota bacterium]
MHAALDAYDPAAALASIWGLVSAANRYVVDTAPWTLADHEGGNDSDTTRLDTVLSHLSESVRLIGEALRPFLPATAERIARQIGPPSQPADWSRRLEWGRLPPATRVGRPEPLFPRLES